MAAVAFSSVIGGMIVICFWVVIYLYLVTYTILIFLVQWQESVCTFLADTVFDNEAFV